MGAKTSLETTGSHAPPVRGAGFGSRWTGSAPDGAIRMSGCSHGGGRYLPGHQSPLQRRMAEQMKTAVPVVPRIGGIYLRHRPQQGAGRRNRETGRREVSHRRKDEKRGRNSGPFGFFCLQAQWLASAFRTAATSAALTGPASLPQALRSQLASSATSSSDMRSA